MNPRKLTLPGCSEAGRIHGWRVNSEEAYLFHLFAQSDATATSLRHRESDNTTDLVEILLAAVNYTGVRDVSGA